MQKRKYSIRDFYFWKITISLALASFFIFAAMYTSQPLLPVFVEDFGVSINIASYSMSITIFSLMIGLILLGFYSDRIGRTVFIKLSIIGSVIPFFIMPLTDSFTIILILRFLQGFAFSGLLATSIAYLNEEVERKSVGVATALYISSNAIGGMFGRVLTGYISDQYSWQHAFYIFAVGGLIIGFLVILLLPNSRYFEPSKDSFQKDVEGFLYHLKNPAMLLVIVVGIVLQLSFTGIWTYLPFHLQAEPFSLSLEMISYTYLAYSLGVVGSPLAGWLAGNFGLDRVRTIGIIVLSIGAFITLSQSIFLVVLGLCIVCLGFFTAHSLTATVVGEKATHHKGSASSLYLVAYYIGVTLGTSAISPLWEYWGWNGIITLSGLLPLLYLGFLKMVTKQVKQSKGNRMPRTQSK